MQINWVYFCGARPYDATESVATHSSRLQPSIIYMSQLQPWCSAALVPKFPTLKSGVKAQVSLETTIELNDLVFYLGLEPALYGRKAKVLPLDHRCLLWWHSFPVGNKTLYTRTSHEYRGLEYWFWFFEYRNSWLPYRSPLKVSGGTGHVNKCLRGPHCRVRFKYQTCKLLIFLKRAK